MPREKTARPDTKIIHSLDKGLEVLELVAESGGVVNLSELAHRLNWDKSTVFRLLTTLSRRGYVDRDEDTKRYYLGFRILRLEQKLFHSLDLPRVSREALHRLSEATGEAAHLAMLQRNQAVIVAQNESKGRVAANGQVGVAEPLHCTAIGKALLSQMPDDTLRRVIGELDLKPYTPKTVTSAEWLLKQVQNIRGTGYAVNEEEYDSEVRCVAAPVRVPSSRKFFAVGVSAPSARIVPGRMSALIDEVVKAADGLTRRFSAAAVERVARSVV